MAKAWPVFDTVGWHILHGKVGRTCRIQLAFDHKRVAGLMNVNGHGLCNRWCCSDKAVGVKNLDAI